MNTYDVLLEGGINITVDADHFTVTHENTAYFYDKHCTLTTFQTRVTSVDLRKEKIETEEKDVDEYTQYREFVQKHVSKPDLTILLADFLNEVEISVRNQKVLRNRYSNLKDTIY